VIAIENARLLSKLRQRTAGPSESEARYASAMKAVDGSL
jgi:hypothetical protein